MDSDNRLQQKDIDNLTTNLARLEKSVASGFSKVDSGFAKVYDRLDIMEAHFIRKESFEKELEHMRNEYKTEFKNQDDKINYLRKFNWWIMTTVGTVILTAVVGSLLAFNIQI